MYGAAGRWTCCWARSSLPPPAVSGGGGTSAGGPANAPGRVTSRGHGGRPGVTSRAVDRCPGGDHPMRLLPKSGKGRRALALGLAVTLAALGAYGYFEVYRP